MPERLVIYAPSPRLTVTAKTPKIQVTATTKTVLHVVASGPPGPAGAINADGALLTVNRLSEFDSAQSRVDARTHLELEHIDCGVFL